MLHGTNKSFISNLDSSINSVYNATNYSSGTGAGGGFSSGGGFGGGRRPEWVEDKSKTDD